MLVQHLLTERLFRKIFDNPEFTRRNVIAAEVEKVIDALVSQSFNRDDFPEIARPLLRGHRERRPHDAGVQRQAALPEHGLRAVLPGLFGEAGRHARHRLHAAGHRRFHVRQRRRGAANGVRQGVWAIADVHILDPCTGTGNFIVNLLRRIPKRDLPRVYREQLFANEVMLLPYYIAALNIEHAYYELTGEYEPFEGLCFVDTLDMAEGEQKHFSFMTEENTERVERQKKTPITVIIGNPPYNVGQLNENDNNKNRKYAVIDKRIKRNLCEGFGCHEQERSFRCLCQIFPLGGGPARRTRRYCLLRDQ